MGQLERAGTQGRSLLGGEIWVSVRLRLNARIPHSHSRLHDARTPHTHAPIWRPGKRFRISARTSHSHTRTHLDARTPHHHTRTHLDARTPHHHTRTHLDARTSHSHTRTHLDVPVGDEHVEDDVCGEELRVVQAVPHVRQALQRHEHTLNCYVPFTCTGWPSPPKWLTSPISKPGAKWRHFRRRSVARANGTRPMSTSRTSSTRGLRSTTTKLFLRQQKVLVRRAPVFDIDLSKPDVVSLRFPLPCCDAPMPCRLPWKPNSLRAKSLRTHDETRIIGER